MVVDASLIKERIINFLTNNGPSLPVHIAKSVGMDMIFTSAFLSELMSHGKIKTSHLKVGTSPIYFIPGQENGLGKFSQYLKGKEHEAFMLLEKEDFLVDEKQEPAIRVALSSIKDFAKPLEKNGNLIWRFFLSEEKNYKNEEKIEPPIETKETKSQPEEVKKKNVRKKTSSAPRKKSSTDEKFFNRVKEFLGNQNVEIEDIVSFNNKELILKVIENNEEKIIVAFNKRRITEKEILLAYKKAEERKMNYSVFSFGELPKKTQTFIDAMKSLNSIEKIE